MLKISYGAKRCSGLFGNQLTLFGYGDQVKSSRRVGIPGGRSQENITARRNLPGMAVPGEHSLEKTPSRRLLCQYSSEENAPRKSWLPG
jgi:hypothetical protein